MPLSRTPAEVDADPRSRLRGPSRDVGEPDPDAEHRGEGARRNLPGWLDDLHSLPRDALVVQHEGNQALGRAYFLLASERFGAGEFLVERTRPAEPRLDRRSLRRDVVSVEWITRFQAEGVARAQAARDDPAREDRVPEPGGIVRIAAQLAAALSRVARPGDEAPDTEYFVIPERERLQLDAQPLERLGPLNGQKGVAIGDVGRLREHRMVRLDISCVHDEQVVVVTPPVRDQVVRDPAPVVGQERVLGAPVADPVEIVRKPCLEIVEGSGTGELELAHVRDVEDARG